jgi:hypothetical protein
VVFVVVVVVVVFFFSSFRTLCLRVCVSLRFEEFCLDFLTRKGEELRFFKTSGPTNPAAQCNISEELNYVNSPVLSHTFCSLIHLNFLLVHSIFG